MECRLLQKLGDQQYEFKPPYIKKVSFHKTRTLAQVITKNQENTIFGSAILQFSDDKGLGMVNRG